MSKLEKFFRYLKALQGLILFSALFHLFLLTVIALREHNLTYLNYFYILDLHYFFPWLVTGKFSHLLSFFTMALIYFLMYRLIAYLSQVENKLKGQK